MTGSARTRINAVFQATTLLALGMIALLWAAIEVNLATERHVARAGAAQQARNLSRLFEEQIRRSITDIDKTLLLVRQAYEEESAEFDLRAWVADQRLLNDLTFQISLIGPDGILTATNAGPSEGRVDLNDREHYRVHVGERPDVLFISKPVLGRASGRWSIQLTRRLRDRGGRFSGVIVGSFDPYRLSQFYSSIDLGPGGAIGVIGQDRIVRSQAGMSEDLIGREFKDDTLFDAVARAPTGLYVAPARDGEPPRLTAYRALEEEPLIITVGISETEIERATLAKAGWYRLAGSGLTLAVLSLAATSIRHRNRLQRTYAELNDSKEEIRRKSRELEVTLDHMDQGIMMVDCDGKTAVMNGRFVELLGLPHSFLHSRPAFDEILEYQWKAGEFGSGGEFLSDPVRSYIGSGGTSNELTTYERTRPNGTVMEVRTTPLSGGGLVRTFSDITLRKEAERASNDARLRAEEAYRVRSVFLATISHEIRTPLNGITGLTYVLKDTHLTDDQRHCLDVIESCSAALLETVNDVLDFSKLETGQLDVQNGPVEVGKLVADVLDIVQPRAAAKDLELFSELDSTVPPVVIADAARLRQVLLNLVSNGVKFTSSGSVAVRAAYRDGGAGSGTLHIQVRDTGMGIPASGLDRLFREFSQVDESVTRRFGGTGLGLAICKRVLEAQGGSIGCTSNEGVGSTFWFEIPTQVGCAPPKEECPERAESSPGEALSILVVEDNPVNRDVAARLLGRLGHRISTADDGREALARCGSTPFDMILMDMQMPEMDGLEATRAIRSLPGWASVVPIIGLTASAFASDRQACLAAGMNEVICKPVDPATLRAVLNRYGARSPATPGSSQAATQRAKLVGELGEDVVEELVTAFWTEAHPRLMELKHAH